MKPAPRYFFMVAGDQISDLVDHYGLGDNDDETVNQIQDEMERTAGRYSMGHTDFDEMEVVVKEALRESAAPFAVVFKGSKLYGFISKERTITHEVIS